MRIILFSAFLCSLIIASNAYAVDSNEGEDHVATQPASQIIDACWAISENDRASGVTSRMRSGALDSALCMEDTILLLVARYLNKDNPDILSQYREDLDNLRAGYGRMMWNLYNYHDGCEGGCGTMYYTFHNLAYAHLLEDILKTTIKQIRDYELQDDLFGVGVLIGKNPDAVKEGVTHHILPQNPSSLCRAGSCGTFSLHEIHGIYAVEGLYQETNQHPDEEAYFISIKGFVTQANEDAFMVHGKLYSTPPQDGEDVCTYSGDLFFKPAEGNTWELDTKNIPCLSGEIISLRP